MLNNVRRKGKIIQDKAIIRFIDKEHKKEYELEIPTDISAKELITALNSAFDLGIDTEDIFDCYLTAEDPIAFLKGNRTLSYYGIRNGSRIIYTRGRRPI